MKLLLITICLLLAAVVLMGVKVLFVKGGKFPSGHVHALPAVKRKKHKKRNTSPPPQEEENNVFLLEDDDITSEEPPTLKAKTNNLDPNANYNNNMYTNEEGNKKSHGSHSKHRSRSHTVSQSNFQAYNDEIQQMKENNNEQLRLLQEEFENKKEELKNLTKS